MGPGEAEIEVHYHLDAFFYDADPSPPLMGSVGSAQTRCRESGLDLLARSSKHELGLGESRLPRPMLLFSPFPASYLFSRPLV